MILDIIIIGGAVIVLIGIGFSIIKVKRKKWKLSSVMALYYLIFIASLSEIFIIMASMPGAIKTFFTDLCLRIKYWKTKKNQCKNNSR